MKCPYCKIHYMDDDRECPMCGTPNPERWSGKQRVNKKYKQSSKASDDRKYSAVRHKETHATAKTVESADLKGKTHRSDKKSSAKIGAVASVAVVVISLIPTLISAVGDVVNDLDFTSSSFVEAEPDIPDSMEPSLDYEVPASAYDTVQGEWVGLDESGYLYLDLDTMDYSYAPDDKVDLEHGYALLYEVEAFDNDDGTTQYGYQVDFYPNWNDYGYSMYLSASNDGGGILMTMKYDDTGYPDGNTLLSWSRPGAQDI
ncbi:hypothetical protein [Butyricicoccus pullicaecorum]|uniref:hypothetical protein n=1 Tax=Butyricicoccus pullicaecorum TaxID=501571 RepID=UPI00352233DE